MSSSAVITNQARTARSRPPSREPPSNSSVQSRALRNSVGSTQTTLARQRLCWTAAGQEGADYAVGALKNGRTVAEVGALEAERPEPVRGAQGPLVRVIDVPGWGAESAFVVEDVSKQERRLRFGVQSDAARRLA